MHGEKSSGKWQQTSGNRSFGLAMAEEDAWVPDAAMDLADEGSPEVEGKTLRNKQDKFKGPHNEDVALTAVGELEASPSSSEGPSNPRPSAGRIRCIDATCEVTFARIYDQSRHYKSKHLGEGATCPYCRQVRSRPDSLKRHIKSCQAKKALDAVRAVAKQEADQEADQEMGQEAARQPQEPQGDAQDEGSQRRMARASEGLREGDGSQAEDRQEEGSRGKVSRPSKREREELEDEDGSQEEDRQQEERPAKAMRRPGVSFSMSLR